MRRTSARAAMTGISLAAFLALLVPSALGSPPAHSRAAKAKKARGSLQLTVYNPTPPCGEFTYPGFECDFFGEADPPGRVKVKSSAHECRARDVKVFQLAPVHGLVDTPGTNRHGVGPTSFGGRYTAVYPGQPINADTYEVYGGTQLSFQAKAPKFKTTVHNSLETLVCKKLKSGIETVTAPTPPPEQD